MASVTIEGRSKQSNEISFFNFSELGVICENFVKWHDFETIARVKGAVKYVYTDFLGPITFMNNLRFV